MRVEFDVAREELEAMSCLRMAFLLVAVLARLSRALWMEVRRPGLRVVVWAELAPSRFGKKAVGPLIVGGKIGSFPGSPGLVGGVEFLPKLSGAGEVVGSQMGSGDLNSQGLGGDGQTGPCCLALGVLQQEDVLGDVQHFLKVLAHLDGEQYHIQCM